MLRKLAIALSIASVFVASAAFAGKTVSTTCTNKIKAVSLAASTTTVSAGMSVAITATFQNPTRASVTVDWVILDETGTKVGSGTVTVGKGATATGGATWTATSGGHVFTLVVDPANTLGEAGACLNDNTKSLAILVP